MSVFKIHQAAAVNKGVETKVEEVKQSTGEDHSVEHNHVNETPVSVEKEEIKGSSPEEGHDDPKLMVKVDGPVGRLFTEALNKMLATEGYVAMIEPDTIVKKEETDHTPSLQVYALKGDEIGMSDVVEITNEISKHDEKDYIVAVESVSQVTRVHGYLEELGKLGNVRLCWSQNSALNAIKDHLRK